MDIKKLLLGILVVSIFAIADSVTELGLPIWITPFLIWLGEWIQEKGGIVKVLGFSKATKKSRKK